MTQATRVPHRVPIEHKRFFLTWARGACAGPSHFRATRIPETLPDHENRLCHNPRRASGDGDSYSDDGSSNAQSDDASAKNDGASADSDNVSENSESESEAFESLDVRLRSNSHDAEQRKV